MAAEKWVAGSGAGLTWTNAFTASTLNSLSNTATVNTILSDLQIDNSSALDMFCDVSISLGSITTSATSACILIAIYPLDADGTTYADGRYVSAGVGLPFTYYAGHIPLVPGVTQAQNGILRMVLMPPGKFKFVLSNFSGANLAGSGANTCQYRTYNRRLV